MGRALGLIASLLFVGCMAPGDAPADAMPAPDATPACIDVERAWYEAWIALDDSCSESSECILVGDDGGYCECRRAGFAVKATAYRGSALEEIGNDLFGRCADEREQLCDVPELEARCVDGHCGAAETFVCNPP